MLSWLRQENISLDFEVAKEATGIFAETCRSSAVGARVDSAAKVDVAAGAGRAQELPSGHHAGEGS